MSNTQAIISLARRSLLVLAAALIMALALYAGSSFFKDRMRTQLAATQQIASANQASLSEKQSDLTNLQAEIKHFNLLRQQGMVGEPDRAGWTEQLVASRQRTGLPDTLVYTLDAPKPLTMQDGLATVAAALETTPADAASPLFHDLNFELSSIHEEELLLLLRDYQTHVKGRFRINTCTLSSRTATGLSARCTLRFFTLPDVKPNPGQ